MCLVGHQPLSSCQSAWVLPGTDAESESVRHTDHMLSLVILSTILVGQGATAGHALGDYPSFLPQPAQCFEDLFRPLKRPGPSKPNGWLPVTPRKLEKSV